MRNFVIMFRQGPFNFTDAVKQRRAQLIGAWAREQNAHGHKLVPRTLSVEAAHVGPPLPEAISAEPWPITALLFLEAADLDEASTLAASHPGVAYNVHIEVREWTTPAPIIPA